VSDSPALAVALLAGVMLGAFFFGGLWWSVQKGVSSERPGHWFFGSLLLRNIMTVAGFYFVSQGHWSRLITCLLGFMLARVIVVRLLSRPLTEQRSQLDKETVDAP
jgi:F1F0 ATPase subunit 2